MDPSLMMSEDIVDLLARPPYAADPHPYFHELRRRAPVYFSETLQLWLVTSHAGAKVLLKSRKFGSAKEAFRRFTHVHADTLTIFSNMLSFVDPPDHTRLRMAVSRGFSLRAVEAMAAEIESAVRDAIEVLKETIAERGSADLMRDFANAMPIAVIGKMLGVSPADHSMLIAGADAMTRTFDPQVSPEVALESARGMTELNGYLVQLVERKRAAPQDDFASGLIALRQSGEFATDQELLSMLLQLLAAGFDTTRNLLGSGAVRVFGNADVLSELHTHPEALDGAVEEMLRMDPPIQTNIPRQALEDVQIDGAVIPAGAFVVPVFAAANRDPARFRDPDNFDIHRPDNEPLTFGPGVHQCLGASLARLEVRIAFRELLASLPDLELIEAAPQAREASPLGARSLGPLQVLVRRSTRASDDAFRHDIQPVQSIQ